MDPIGAAGIALSVASLAGQVFTGCIQGNNPSSFHSNTDLMLHSHPIHHYSQESTEECS
jgi:hypothetical protein